jgi:gamma-glutamylcyclotransferase (GGCT)/AIG2-like uncharacterized protein YtfP
MTDIPFFVYGTLLPEQPNFRLWGDSISRMEYGRIKDCQLFDMGAYPMLVESKEKYVHGMLVFVIPEYRDEMITIIDELEGYNPEKHGESAYNREMQKVELESGKTVTAWVYLGHQKYIDQEKPILGGKWAKHVARKGKEQQDWWEDTNTVAGLHEK